MPSWHVSRPCSRTGSSALVALALVLVASTPLGGQLVSGTVRDPEGRAIPTALVLLLDSAGRQQAAALSDTAGRFAIRTTAAGAYQLRVERIGYRTTAPVAVELRAGTVETRDVVATTLPVELPPLTASVQRRCTARPAEGEVVAMLWYEARKGLQVSQLGHAPPAYTFRTRRWVQRLQLPTLRVLQDTTQVRLERARGNPFVSAPVDKLLAEGFIERTEAGTVYYAPDAQVLLSDQFADAYCLTPVEDRRAARVGIEFRPVARSGPAAVMGTLWLDRGTLELRQLVYGYTRAELPQGRTELLGGTLNFERLPDGTWIIRKWYIRVPVVSRQAMNYRNVSLQRELITGIREEGAEVLEVRDEQGRPIAIDTTAVRR
jgi:hypothetical protein